MEGFFFYIGKALMTFGAYIFYRFAPGITAEQFLVAVWIAYFANSASKFSENNALTARFRCGLLQILSLTI